MVKLMLTLLAIGPLVLAGVAPSSAQVRPDFAIRCAPTRPNRCVPIPLTRHARI